MELRILAFPDGQEVLQFRMQLPGRTILNSLGHVSGVTQEWTDWRPVPRVDYRAAQCDAAEQLPKEGI